MRELSRVMPAGSWLQSPTRPSPATSQAATAATSDGGRAEAERQPRRLHAEAVGRGRDDGAAAPDARVTDVKLNESSTELAPRRTEVTVDSCGSYYQFNVTVSFAQTAPATEAPRGAARVPAALGGGS